MQNKKKTEKGKSVMRIISKKELSKEQEQIIKSAYTHFETAPVGAVVPVYSKTTSTLHRFAVLEKKEEEVLIEPLSSDESDLLVKKGIWTKSINDEL